jgi:hypothetical protein
MNCRIAPKRGSSQSLKLGAHLSVRREIDECEPECNPIF